MKTNKLTFGAMAVAVSVVFMLIGTFAKTGTLAVYFVLSLDVMITKSSSGTKTAILAYFVTTALAFIMPVDIKISIMYALLFGLYPIVKAFAEKRKAVLQWVIKLVCFNAELAGTYLLFKTFAPVELPITAVIAIVVTDVAFVLYDILLSYVHTIYVNNVDKFIIRK